MHLNAHRIVNGFSFLLAAGMSFGVAAGAHAQPAAQDPGSAPSFLAPPAQAVGDPHAPAPAKPGFDWTGISVHYPEGANAQNAPLTPHFAAGVDFGTAPEGAAAAEALVPAYETGAGEASVRVPAPSDAPLYGAGAAPGKLVRNGSKVLCNAGSGGVPWVLGVRADGSAFGILFDSTWESELEFPGPASPSSEIVFRTPGPACRVITIEGETPMVVLRRLGFLVGPAAMPPRWALGHQVLIGDTSEDAIRSAATALRTNHIPADGLWLGESAMSAGKPFTSDGAKLPNPIGLDVHLSSERFFVVWPTPGAIPETSGYWIRDQLFNSGFAVRDEGGKPLLADGDGGQFYAPDFTRPEVRSWWAGLQKELVAKGADGVAVSWPAQALSATAQYGGGAWAEGARPSAGSIEKGGQAQLANVSATLMAKAAREGLLKARSGFRPFVVSDGASLGANRYAATLLNAGDDQDGPAPALGLGISGQPIVGVEGLPLGIASLLPLCATPYDGAGTSETVRAALQRRMRLLPYLATLVENAAFWNSPIVRPLFFADPKDAALRSVEDSFLLGGDLLAMPRAMRDSAEAPFPKASGKWERVDLVGGAEFVAADLPDLYIRPGAIVPLGPVLGSTSDPHSGPLTLLVNLDIDGQAAGSLYEDSGEGFDHLRDFHLRTDYKASLAGDRLDIKIAGRSGKNPRPTRELNVVVVRDGFYHAVKSQDGMSLRVNMSKLNPVKVGDASHVGGGDPQPARGKPLPARTE